MTSRSQRVLLQTAVGLVGPDRVAAFLKVPGTTLALWVNGHATMPDRKLLTLIDLIDELRDLH